MDDPSTRFFLSPKPTQLQRGLPVGERRTAKLHVSRDAVMDKCPNLFLVAARGTEEGLDTSTSGRCTQELAGAVGVGERVR